LDVGIANTFATQQRKLDQPFPIHLLVSPSEDVLRRPSRKPVSAGITAKSLTYKDFNPKSLLLKDLEFFHG
jgi:hypothetical protein